MKPAGAELYADRVTRLAPSLMLPVTNDPLPAGSECGRGAVLPASNSR
jgi:hypothetical protein